MKHLTVIQKTRFGIYDLTDFHCIFKSDKYEYTIQNLETGQKYLEGASRSSIYTDENEGKYALLEYRHPSVLYATFTVLNLITGMSTSFLHKCLDENALFRTTLLKNNVLNIMDYTYDNDDMTVCRYDLPACTTGYYPVPEGSILYSEQPKKIPFMQRLKNKVNRGGTILSLHDTCSCIWDRKNAYKIHLLERKIELDQLFFKGQDGAPFTLYQLLIENKKWLSDHTIAAFLIKQIIANINQSSMPEEQYQALNESYTTYINELFSESDNSTKKEID